MPSQSTRAKFSPSQIPRKSGSSMIISNENLAYLAVSRVEYMHQLERVVCPPEEGSECARTLTEQQFLKVIQRKLVAYKRQDQAKGLRFSQKVDHILALEEAQNNRCAACNIELLWAYQPKDTQQFSVDQFVLQDGRTYKTRETHERLKAICAKLGNPELSERAFGENHAASIMAKERNGWKPTLANLLPDIEKACVEHGHGGLWNSMDYDTREVTSIDMKACYPASFQGMGEAKPYFERFGHPTHPRDN